MTSKRNISQEDMDSLSELFNLTFGAAASRIDTGSNKSIKLIYPSVDEVEKEHLTELLKESHYVHISKTKAFHRGGFIFMLSLETVNKLVSFIAKEEVDAKDNTQSEVALKILDNFFTEIKSSADATLETTVGKAVSFDEGKSGFFDIDGLDLASEYSEGIIEVKLKLVIENTLESVLHCFLPLGFAINLNSSFIQAVNVQVSEFVPTWTDEREIDIDRLRKVILYCQQVGNFSLIADLKVNLKVCLASKKMTLREFWELNQGSLLEFKKNYKDYVDVFFGDKCIAVADVVTLNDKFGVKVKEVRR